MLKDRSVSPFRPYTEAQLLGLARAAFAITEPDHHLITSELDSCQTILLRWGCFIPWSWSIWNDSRMLQYEVIKVLVCFLLWSTVRFSQFMTDSDVAMSY